MSQIHNIKYLYFLIIALMVSCSAEKNPSKHFRQKQIFQDGYGMLYESGHWEHPNYSRAFETFGNHRIIIEVEDTSGGFARVVIPWRRGDENPQQKDVIIVDAKTNAPVENKLILENNNEYGELIFKPNKQSFLYYVYYLPHGSTGGYYPKLHYKKANETSVESWLSQNKLAYDQIENLPGARIISAQSIDDFHSFFPMEIIATEAEVSDFISQNPAPYYLFPEYRDHPVRMQEYLPQHWVSTTTLFNGLSDTALRGEYYTFQVGIYSPQKDLQDLQVTFTDMKGLKGGNIPSEMITCFNKGGIDMDGKTFEKTIEVKAGKVQALWFGVGIPQNTPAGKYNGLFIIKPDGYAEDTVYLELSVSSDTIANFGDDSPENMTRLHWLNSTIGTGKDIIVRPFEAVKITGSALHILGREIIINEYGFPDEIYSYFTQEMTGLKEEKEGILAHPIKFNIFDSNGEPEKWEATGFFIEQEHPGEAEWETSNSSRHFSMHVSGRLEYDGMLDYKIRLIASADVNVSDIRLTIPMQEEAAVYIMGLGLKGGKLKDRVAWKWDIEYHQEGAWLGAVNKGLQFVLRDENYERPLNTNFYHDKPLNLPYSWYNEGKGGININSGASVVSVENYSGSRDIHAGDTLNFNVRFLLTPFKLIDTREHFSTRFVHKYLPVDSIIKLNGTIVNVHHANEINPYINYPFYNIEEQKAYIEEAHSKGIKVKLYNTIRELSYRAYELFALKSLGDEILNDGRGGGHSWLQEHLRSDYYAAWHATSVNDAAVLNKGNSRWTNYYIEGINWLAENQEIDGLYLDDIAFSRTTVKRIAAVLNKHRENYVIDLHSANQYNNRDGYTNSAFLYMEHFPYISRLWFGEYFEYDLGPDYWLTEVSGIPFGLTGEMLQDGGHPYRGMVYGMTTRVYGEYNPGAMWKLFDDFAIADAEMLGYWVDRSPVKTDIEGIRTTIYKQQDRVLISMGSWSDNDEKVKLHIDWDNLGFDKNHVCLYSPEIEGLQLFKNFGVDQAIPVEKNKGLILVLETCELGSQIK